MLSSVIPLVRQGAVAPEAIVLNVPPGNSTSDLSTATAASFRVRKPNGEIATWAADLVGSPTPLLLTAQHLFAAGDTDQLGEHLIYASVTLPGGVVRSVTKTFKVVSEFGD